jgi:hypothetical protein
MRCAPGAPAMRWCSTRSLIEHDGDDLCSLSLLQGAVLDHGL